MKYIIDTAAGTCVLFGSSTITPPAPAPTPAPAPPPPAPAPTPPPPAPIIRCSPQVNYVNLTLDGRTDFVTGAIDGRLVGQQIYVVRLIPGAFMNTVGKGKDGINLLSWNVRAGYATREAVVSPCPGDFTSSEAQVMFRATPDETGSGAGINWVLDEPNRAVHARCAKITTGRDWYLNIRNTQCFDEKDICIHYLFAIPAANRT